MKRATVLAVLLIAVIVLGGCEELAQLDALMQPETTPAADTPPAMETPPAGTPGAPVGEATLVPPATPAPAQEIADEASPEGLAAALSQQFNRVYTTVGEAVVQVTSLVPTEGFFMQAQPQVGTGSGFVFDDQGHVVTNYHVVAEAQEVSVGLRDGRRLPAVVVGMDPSTDLAVLQVEGEDLPAPMPLADSDELLVGQWVVAMGNPFGLDNTLTVGVISALERIIQSPDQRFIGGAIQTDAAINPGNSGGPLVDLSGRVVGVNSQIVSPSGAFAGIGFAVPSSTVARIVPVLIAEGSYPHSWLGILPVPLSPALIGAIQQQADVEFPVEEGVLVAQVVPGSPADEAGLRAGQQAVSLAGTRIPVDGDIITAIDGEPITGVQELNVYLERNTTVGQQIEITFYRDGDEMTTTATLQRRPE